MTRTFRPGDEVFTLIKSGILLERVKETYRDGRGQSVRFESGHWEFDVYVFHHQDAAMFLFDLCHAIGPLSPIPIRQTDFS